VDLLYTTSRPIFANRKLPRLFLSPLSLLPLPFHCSLFLPVSSPLSSSLQVIQLRSLGTAVTSPSVHGEARSINALEHFEVKNSMFSLNIYSPKDCKAERCIDNFSRLIVYLAMGKLGLKWTIKPSVYATDHMCLAVHWRLYSCSTGLTHSVKYRPRLYTYARAMYQFWAA